MVVNILLISLGSHLKRGSSCTTDSYQSELIDKLNTNFLRHLCSLRHDHRRCRGCDTTFRFWQLYYFLYYIIQSRVSKIPAWWCMVLIPALKRQRQADLCDSGLHIKFQNSWGYMVRPCLQNKNTQTKNTSPPPMKVKEKKRIKTIS